MQNDHIYWHVYERAFLTERVRQGDAITKSGEKGAVAIVVTADCDLANEKHGRTLTCVPLVSAVTVAEQYLYFDRLDKESATIASYLQRFVRKGAMSSQDLRAEIKVMLEEARLPAPTMMVATAYLHEIEALTYKDYVAIRKEVGLSTKEPDRAIRDQLRNKGDLLCLPPAPGLRSELRIAWLRRIFQVRSQDVVIELSKWTSTNWMRVARLESPFVYKLTQRLGQVFSDVGTPDIDSAEIPYDVSEP